MNNVFSGSYDADDVRFLLNPVYIQCVSVEEKEHRIQSGQSHYSEMLSEEHFPSPQYLQLFEEAMQRNAARFARDIWRLARLIVQEIELRRCNEITLVSLARAGTPVGVLLCRCLQLLGWKAPHYSISIIRDHGIDRAALQYILVQEGRQPQGVVFVDGWTGKGVIGAELKKSLADFFRSTGIALSPSLHVVADLCGQAEVSATFDDYLLPSSLLNAIISGLISRSVLSEQLVKAGEFHACAYYAHWLAVDKSRWFVDAVFAEVQAAIPHMDEQSPQLAVPDIRQTMQKRSRAFLHHCQQKFGITNINHIKPGIGEATRVLLRRVPHLVLIREVNDDTRHLVALAKEKSVPVLIDADLPYTATAIIRTVTSS